MLSAYGADFTAATTTGENAIHFATKANNLLCLRFLGQRGERRSAASTLASFPGHAVGSGVVGEWPGNEATSTQSSVKRCACIVEYVSTLSYVEMARKNGCHIKMCTI